MRPATARLILGVLAVAAVCLTRPPHARSDAPKADTERTQELSSVNLFINRPADIRSVLDRLTRPDFILLTEDELEKRIDQARRSAAAERARQAAIVSVTVRGETSGDLATVDVEYGINLPGPDTTWVPIRLDEQNLAEVHEGDREIPTRNVAGKGWEVELTGAGRHHVRVRLSVRLKTAADGARLDIAIPEAPSTRFELEIPQRVVDASTGSNEPVDHEAVEGGQRTRLSQLLTARSRLDVSWRVEAEPGVQLPPLLSIQGEIAIDIDPGSFRTRSSWSISAVRGTARSLELRLDPNDEVLELELDGQPAPPAGIEPVNGATLTINLSEPLRPGTPRKLAMATRRPLPATPTSRIGFSGFPLANAKEQSGAIAIAKTGDIWVQPSAGRGLLQIDPRELPDNLRVRPATTLAYQFVDQPFDLSLRVEPSPPLVSTRSRTRVGLSARQARVESRIDYQTARGRLFDVTIALPQGLELDSVGPPGVVDSSKLVSETPDGMRLIKVLLTPAAREQRTFSIDLLGRQSIDPSKPVAIDLFQPRGTTTGGGRIAVIGDRSLGIELPEPQDHGGPADEFRLMVSGYPQDWPWPADRSANGTESPVALWLRHDGNPAALPLRVTVHPKSVSHRTTLTAQVGRAEIGLRQETRCSVHFGTLSSVDVLIPPALVGRWELDADEVADRTDLGLSASGDRVFRLRFAKTVTNLVRLKFRARLPLATPLEPNRPTGLEIPWIRVREGVTEPMQIGLDADPGIELETAGAGWIRSAPGEALSDVDLSPAAQIRLTSSEPSPGATPLKVTATALPVASLPAVVIPRLWLRSVQGPENQVRATASYWVEEHGPALTLALPSGAELVRARARGETLRRVEPLPDGAGFRFRLPTQLTSQPVLVEVEYTIPGRLSQPPWPAPRLLDEGVIQETLWEVRLPGNRAVVGVPGGWTDENEWAWDRYVWKRRPWKSGRALAAWVSGSETSAGPADPFDGEARSDYHSYLFGRSGAPSELRLTVASRAWLVAICSGAVMIAGALFLSIKQRPGRLLAGLLAALLVAVSAAAEPSTTFVALQSGAVGLLLVFVAAGLQRAISRRRHAHSVFGEPNRLVASAGTGSSMSRASGVGSDDPTAIRVRPASTADYVVNAPPPAERSSRVTPTPESS